MTPLGIAAEKVQKILLIEKDSRDAAMTLAALEESQLANQVAVVRDSEDALDYLYRRGQYTDRVPDNPILVLLDSKTPKASSLRVLKTLKVDEHLQSIPVVVLTSSRETSDLAEFYKHGVVAYVVKPVNFAEFMKTIKQLGLSRAAMNEPLFAGS